MANENDRDDNPFCPPYLIGYKKPPAEHRFKPGNKAAAGKRGPRKAKRLNELTHKVLNERVSVLIDGKPKRITRAEAMVRQLINLGGKSPRDGLRLLGLASTFEPVEPPAWVDQTIKVAFVHREWGPEDCLPGDPGDEYRERLAQARLDTAQDQSFEDEV